MATGFTDDAMWKHGPRLNNPLLQIITVVSRHQYGRSCHITCIWQQLTCPCGKRQTMSCIVNSCPQSKLEGAAAIALSWWRCYRMAEDIIIASKCTRQQQRLGTQLTPPKGHSPLFSGDFSGDVYCGQTVAHLSYCWALVKFAFSALTVLVEHQEKHSVCTKNWVMRCWHVICLEQGADDLHMI